jgi:hypothetical protein
MRRLTHGEARDNTVSRQTGLRMNVLFRTFVLTGALAALAVPALAATGIHQNGAMQDPGRMVAAAFGPGPDVLLSKKFGQSDGDFKRACDKRNGVVTKRAKNVVCVARMHMGSMRGSYDRVPAGDGSAAGAAAQLAT